MYSWVVKTQATILPLVIMLTAALWALVCITRGVLWPPYCLLCDSYIIISTASANRCNALITNTMKLSIDMKHLIACGSVSNFICGKHEACRSSIMRKIPSGEENQFEQRKPFEGAINLFVDDQAIMVLPGLFRDRMQ